MKIPFIKLVMITGATSGIGSAAAKIFAKNGFNLVIKVEEKIVWKISRKSFKQNMVWKLSLFALIPEITKQ